MNAALNLELQFNFSFLLFGIQHWLNILASQNMENRRNENSTTSVDNVDEEKLRTLWCGSISEKVDEEILFELFQNAGPLERVVIPKDRDTGRQKSYAFIVFQHVESVKFAFELLNSTELFKQPIRLQQKETGLGIPTKTNIFCVNC